MTTKTLAFIMLIFIISSSFVFIFLGEKSEAAGNEIFVDDDLYLIRDGSAEHPYQTIQDALNVANDGDTIYVFGGSYNEMLTINKRVTIVGSIEEGDSIINYNSDHKYTIQITADYVNLTGFIIIDNGYNIISEINGALIHVTSSNVIIQNNNITDCSNGYGIYLDSSDGHLIKDNIISNVSIGIYLYDSNTNDFVGNKISNCVSAAVNIRSSYYNTLFNNILDNNRYGVYALDCEKINITNNTIESNNLRGIGLYGGNGSHIISNNVIRDNTNQGLYLNSPNGIVIGNTFDNNQLGITLDTSNYKITNNYINNSYSIGIDVISGFVGNVIYLNSFYGNDVNADDPGNTIWYNESLKAGNTWDDYGEIDRDNDGIGDTIYQKSGVYDKYPLGIFLKPPSRPSNPSPADNADNVGLKITLSVKVTDPDRDLMDVYFYRLSSETTIDSLLGINYNVFSGDTASCSFNLPFDTNLMWNTTVKDSKLENQSDIWFFTTRRRPASNEPPIADAGGSYNGDINKTIVFDASNSYDPDGDIEFYRWNFGDGTSEILSVSPTHVYYSNGTFDVTLTVIDNNGTSAMEVVKVTISSSAPGDQSPVAASGGPYNGKVGDAISFDGSGSYDPDGTIINWNWLFGDGGTSAEQNPTHPYSTAGKFTVTLTVSDQNGNEDTDSTEILIKTKSTEESPGYEIILAIIAMLIISIILKKR